MGLSCLRHFLLSEYSFPLFLSERGYDMRCVVNKSIAPSVDGNYVDCYKEENFLNQKIDCCRDINDAIFCCNKKQWVANKMAKRNEFFYIDITCNFSKSLSEVGWRMQKGFLFIRLAYVYSLDRDAYTIVDVLIT